MLMRMKMAGRSLIVHEGAGRGQGTQNLRLPGFGEGDAQAPVLDADGAAEQLTERGVRARLGGLIGGGRLGDIGHEFGTEVGLALDGGSVAGGAERGRRGRKGGS